jgi:fructose-bisphosphate aldolase class II
MLGTAQLMRNARQAGLVIPAFNTPYLPMIEPVIRAVVDEDAFALVETALLEWYKFEARSAAAVAEEFRKHENPDHVRLHLDHVPVIDEDGKRWDYLAVVAEALTVGYQSVMVDGSRLDLEANIAATRMVADLAHAAGVPCEAELGAVMGHETGPLPPYEELFKSGIGFTDVHEARRFVRETGCDWLSVAVGNIHGAISGALKDQKKVEAMLDLKHLQRLSTATGVPLVLHGGSGVKKEHVLKGIKEGISKINVGTEIRHAYEQTLRETSRLTAAQDAVYDRTRWVLRDYYGISGDRRTVRQAA